MCCSTTASPTLMLCTAALLFGMLAASCEFECSGACGVFCDAACQSWLWLSRTSTGLPIKASCSDLCMLRTQHVYPSGFRRRALQASTTAVCHRAAALAGTLLCRFWGPAAADTALVTCLFTLRAVLCAAGMTPGQLGAAAHGPGQAGSSGMGMQQAPPQALRVRTLAYPGPQTQCSACLLATAGPLPEPGRTSWRGLASCRHLQCSAAA